MSTSSFVASQNVYDWLGHGIYFWEYAPFRAWQWAKSKHRDYAAVIQADIELGHCLDLTDIEYTEAIKLAYERLLESFFEKNEVLPENRGGARCLDCLVINYVGEYIMPECDTVRAPFLEGAPIYPGSNLLTQSHIQLVVRKSARIRPDLKLLLPEV
ncbi:hypothetical protein [Candidatus Korobacter versatilis]|nr:hypothetical protein [Candidatus Koribacter versatilis]